MFGITVVISSDATGALEMSRFHALSFGKILQPACVVPGPAVPPLDPFDPPELAPSELAPPELAPPELDVLELGLPFSSSLQAAPAPNAKAAATKMTDPDRFEVLIMRLRGVYPGSFPKYRVSASTRTAR